MIENLVFKGCGVKGIAYAGVLQALEENNILKNIKRCSGTSAGAIVAALVCLNYTTAEIKDILNKTNFKLFKDNLNIFRLFRRYGLYKGDYFLKWFQQLIINKGFDKNITFKELLEKTNRGLYVFSSNINIRDIQGFSADYTPNVRIAEAVRASMSIPTFFKASTITGLDGIYIDGGIAYNYPMSVFDNDFFLIENEPYNKRTIGFYLNNVKKNNVKNNLNFNKPFLYLKELLLTIYEVENINFRKKTHEINRTVFIDDYDISYLDFNLSDTNKELLYKSGYNSTIDYIKSKFDASNK